jgi:hypothetical protein
MEPFFGFRIGEWYVFGDTTYAKLRPRSSVNQCITDWLTTCGVDGDAAFANVTDMVVLVLDVDKDGPATGPKNKPAIRFRVAGLADNVTECPEGGSGGGTDTDDDEPRGLVVAAGRVSGVARSTYTSTWWRHGKLHRQDSNELPAVVVVAGGPHKQYLAWWLDGKRHREHDLPAKECGEDKEWYRDGLVHRDCGLPAVDRHGGSYRVWAVHGNVHRDDDEPAYVLGRGGPAPILKWFKHGETHRDGDLPAIIRPDSTQYFKHDHLHRDGDKPAVIHDSGDCEWWLNGHRHRDHGRPAVVRKFSNEIHLE